MTADDLLASFRANIIPLLDAAYNFARYLSRDADAAQDIVQDAFLRAYRSFDGYRGGDARAWIFKIVRNCYHDWLADRRRAARLNLQARNIGDIQAPALVGGASDGETAEALMIRKSESETVRNVLETMPRPLCEIIVLREFEELSYRQISEITSLPIGTVMSRLARARRTFGEAWHGKTNAGAPQNALLGAEPVSERR